MNTLVIHPYDPTTDFLSVIYKDKYWTVIRENVSKKVLIENIKAHKRIVMLGHGYEGGLFGFDRVVINSELVYLLREKQCVCIWCNAQYFVEKYELKGFYTGMIISDDMEANMYCVNTKPKEIKESNALFAKAILAGIDKKDMLTEVVNNYKGNTDIIEFNAENLFHR